MKLSKNLKVVIAVLVAFIVALTIAAVVPFAVKKAYAAPTNPEIQLCLVNSDGTAYTGEADFSTEYTENIYVKAKFVDPTNSTHTSFSLFFDYDDTLLELQPSGVAANLVIPAEGLESMQSGIVNGKIRPGGDIDKDGSFDLFTAVFKIKNPSVIEAAGIDREAAFSIDDVKFNNMYHDEANDGPRPTISQTLGTDEGAITSIKIHPVSEDDSTLNDEIVIKAVDSSDNPVGNNLASTFDDDHTFDIDELVEFSTEKLYIEVAPNSKYATLTSDDLEYDGDDNVWKGVVEVEWDTADESKGTIAAPFSIKAEKSSKAAKSYDITLERDTASDDVTAKFEIKAGDGEKETKNLEPVEGATGEVRPYVAAASVSMVNAIPNADREHVVVTFAPTINGAEMAVSYVPAKDDGTAVAGEEPVAIENGDELSLESGKYLATIVVTSEVAKLAASAPEGEKVEEKKQVATYTVLFEVEKSDNVGATLKVEAGETPATVYDEELDKDTTGTQSITTDENKIAYKDHKFIVFTFEAVDENAQSIEFKYIKQGASGDGTEVTSGENNEIDNGTYNATLKVVAEDGTDKTYNFTFKVEDPDQTVTVESVTLSKGSTNLTIYTVDEDDEDDGTYTEANHTYAYTDALPIANKSGWTCTVEKSVETQEITGAVEEAAGSINFNSGSNTLEFTVTAEDEVHTQEYVISISVESGLKLKEGSSLYFATYNAASTELEQLVNPHEYKDVPKVGGDGDDKDNEMKVFLAGFTASMFTDGGYGQILRDTILGEFDNNITSLKVTKSNSSSALGASSAVMNNAKISLMNGTTELQSVYVTLLGDVNCDGSIDAYDMSYLIAILAGNLTPNDYQMLAANLTRVGTSATLVDSDDINALQQHSLQLGCLFS